MVREFKPNPGQIDFTHIKRVPVVNCVVRYQGKFLIVQRSEEIRFYPEYWNGISGFLDDGRSVEEKLRAELDEELGLRPQDIISVRLVDPFEYDDPRYNKTWIINPVLVDVRTDKIKLDWEAKDSRWVDLQEVKEYNVVPGFEKVLAVVFPSGDSAT